jgi:pre-mRNA-processing factor 17
MIGDYTGVPQGKRIGKAFVEATAIDEFTFNQQYQSFQRSGYAHDLSSNRIVGNYDNYVNDQSEETLTGKKRKREKGPKPLPILPDDDDEDLGPWALYKDEFPEPSNPSAAPSDSIPYSNSLGESSKKDKDDELNINPVPSNANEFIIEPDAEEERWERKNERDHNFTLPPRPRRGSHACEARSIFHGESEVDFQGRSWKACPQGIRADDGDHDCFLPKKNIKRMTGHSKGVQTIEFFPGTGHLLLSSSLDGTCKVWDVAQESYHPLRSYLGHSEGIRCAQLNNNGDRFLSSGFDRYIRLWDTETGQAVGTFSNRKMSYSVQFYPHDNNIFLAAASDNKIYQWDARTGEICQQYNYHLQACTTLLFIDQGRKFVSTSDDKKLLVWEYDIPVPVQYIQEPEMQCMPALANHRTEDFFLGQSMDNRIVVYSNNERVKLNRKKVFKGHNNTGYACQMDTSPNGKYLISGDGLGSLYIWDWKTSKIFRKFAAHDGGPCMGATWHPLHPSRVATCGWDGLIKIWE